MKDYSYTQYILYIFDPYQTLVCMWYRCTKPAHWFEWRGFTIDSRQSREQWSCWKAVCWWTFVSVLHCSCSRGISSLRTFVNRPCAKKGKIFFWISVLFVTTTTTTTISILLPGGTFNCRCNGMIGYHICCSVILWWLFVGARGEGKGRKLRSVGESETTIYEVRDLVAEWLQIWWKTLCFQTWNMALKSCCARFFYSYSTRFLNVTELVLFKMYSLHLRFVLAAYQEMIFSCLLVSPWYSLST